MTPGTFLATSAARLESSMELTNPLNCTMPLKDLTLMSSDSSLAVANIEDFTLVVIVALSKDSPKLSDVLLPAQLATETTNTRHINKRSIKFNLLIIDMFF